MVESLEANLNDWVETGTSLQQEVGALRQKLEALEASHPPPQRDPKPDAPQPTLDSKFTDYEKSQNFQNSGNSEKWNILKSEYNNQTLALQSLNVSLAQKTDQITDLTSNILPSRDSAIADLQEFISNQEKCQRE